MNDPLPQQRHPHYFKSVEGLTHVDVYRVLHLFNVMDPCIQHAVKKLLVAGGRGAGKDISRDVKEAVDSLQRWQHMRQEEAQAACIEEASDSRQQEAQACTQLPGLNAQDYEDFARRVRNAGSDLRDVARALSSVAAFMRGVAKGSSGPQAPTTPGR